MTDLSNIFTILKISDWLKEKFAISKPKLKIQYHNKKVSHRPNGIEYYTLSITNEGLAPAKSCILYINLNGEILCPEWDRPTRFYIMRSRSVEDCKQANSIDIFPSETVSIPLFILPVSRCKNESDAKHYDYVCGKAYFYDIIYFYDFYGLTNKRRILVEGTREVNAILFCDNYHAKLKIVVNFDSSKGYPEVIEAKVVYPRVLGKPKIIITK